MDSIITIEEAIADKFVAARLSGSALDDFPGNVPPTLAAAYQIQDFGIARMNDAVAGWKVGRIFPPLSIEFGCDRLAGPIFNKSIQILPAAMQGNARSPAVKVSKTPVGSVFTGGFGAVEAEFMLRFGVSPNAGQTRFNLAEAAALIDVVHIGIEIASSPLSTINALGPAVTAADFGNNNGLLVGTEIKDWQSSDFANWIVSTAIDDVEVGRGSASVFPDGPIGAVRFLLELMAQRGIRLPAGTWVSSGAITGVHDVQVGQRVCASFTSNLSVSCVVAAVPQIVSP